MKVSRTKYAGGSVRQSGHRTGESSTSNSEVHKALRKRLHDVAVIYSIVWSV